ncbi:MAG: asparagine synthase [Bacteroidales bacterium]|nr:asparagine synthase [Bacteroidales bacterium]
MSGGMDSAILASYMTGCDAYTFRFLNGTFQSEELHRAEKYAQKYKLNLHYVDINWDIIDRCLDEVMSVKGAPVHSIEPQIFQAAKQAEQDGVSLMIIGDGSDYVFGGMDKLLSKDWNIDDFEKRYTYITPSEVLREPVPMTYLFERYRLPGNKIDFLQFFQDITIDESYASYQNAFKAAGMPYLDPYASLYLAEPLDLNRIRNGESKYLIRQLFSIKYPDLPVPEKVPMPRPVDNYFADWKGPKRPEFLSNIDVSRFNGNQKWLLYCLERFLNLHEK